VDLTHDIASVSFAVAFDRGDERPAAGIDKDGRIGT